MTGANKTEASMSAIGRRVRAHMPPMPGARGSKWETVEGVLGRDGDEWTITRTYVLSGPRRVVTTVDRLRVERGWIEETSS